MIVAELIEKLEQMPKDLPVINGSCSQEVEIVDNTDDQYMLDGSKISCVIIA